MTELQAIFYGIAQGLTEFLPVSSSGHLALLHAADGAVNETAFTFDIALHIATALAVVVYFRADIKRLIFTVFRMLGGLPVGARKMLGMARPDAARFAYLLALPIILGGGILKNADAAGGDVAIDWN